MILVAVVGHERKSITCEVCRPLGPRSPCNVPSCTLLPPPSSGRNSRRRCGALGTSPWVGPRPARSVDPGPRLELTALPCPAPSGGGRSSALRAAAMPIVSAKATPPIPSAPFFCSLLRWRGRAPGRLAGPQLRAFRNRPLFQHESVYPWGALPEKRGPVFPAAARCPRRSVREVFACELPRLRRS